MTYVLAKSPVRKPINQLKKYKVKKTIMKFLENTFFVVSISARKKYFKDFNKKAAIGLEQ